MWKAIATRALGKSEKFLVVQDEEIALVVMDMLQPIVWGTKLIGDGHTHLRCDGLYSRLVSQSDKAFGMALECYEMLKDIQTYNKESVD